MLDSQSLIPMMPPAQALKSIQVMADHSHNWYDGASTRQRSNDNSDDIGFVTNRLNSLEYDMLKFKENIHAIQVRILIKKDKKTKQKRTKPSTGMERVQKTEAKGSQRMRSIDWKAVMD
ncbi:hypothetical protein Tco_0031686 [Tanacetum coccineum]